MHGHSCTRMSDTYIYIYATHTCVHIHIYIILINTTATPDTYTTFFSFRLMKNRRIIDAVDGVMLVARIFFVNRCRNKVQILFDDVIRSFLDRYSMHKSRLKLSTCLIVGGYSCLIVKIQNRRVYFEQAATLVNMRRIKCICKEIFVRRIDFFREVGSYRLFRYIYSISV